MKRGTLDQFTAQIMTIKNRNRREFTTLVLAASLFSLPSYAQVEDFVTGIPQNFLTLHEARLYFKADCSQGFTRSRITARPAESTNITIIYNPAACSASTHLISELGVGDYYVFWLNGLGQLQRVDNYGWSSPSTITTTPNPGNLTVNGQVTVSPGYVYWTEEFTEFRDRSIIYRARQSTPSSPEEVADFTADDLAAVVGMEALSDDRVIVLLLDGRLLDVQRRLFGSPPFQFYAWTRGVVSSIASAFHIREDRLFWTEPTSDRRSVFFKSAPLTDLTDDTIHHIAFRTTGHDVVKFVADNANLYYQDLTSSSSGPLVRKSLTSSAAAEELAAIPFQIQDMVLTPHHVIWRKNTTTASRLPINAAAITRDLAATGLEVVQVIQNPANENPLVMGKPTFVRFFGRIVSSSAGEASLNVWPPAVLHGDKDGVPLPGSPLTPLQAPAITSNAVDRTTMAGDFLFRLPHDWTTRGVVRLRGVLNPNRAVSETSFANNTRQFDANFARKAPICMVMYPTRTRVSTIRYYQPYMQPMFDYIEALLPTSRLRNVWPGGEIEEPYDPFHWIGDGGPFEVSSADDDSWTLLIELTNRKVFTSNRYCEGNGGFDHYCAMLRTQDDMPGWSGIARMGNEDTGLTEIASAFFMRLNVDSLGVPRSANTQWQELAHNYGRPHVDCGGPDGVDHGYPYDTDKIFSPGSDYIGFHPFRRALVLPDSVADFMSYCDPAWVSDYTWKKLFNRFGNLSGSAAPAPAFAPMTLAASPSPGNSFLIGFYDEENQRAAFKQALPLAGSAELAAAQTLISRMESEPGLELRAFRNGAQQGSIPVYFSHLASDEGAGHGATFVSIANIQTGWNEVQLVNAQKPGTPLARLLGGGAAPTVNVTEPSAGTSFTRAEPLVMKWTASDPDNNALAFTLRFSRDGGANWQVLASGTPDTELAMDSTGIPGSTNCLIEVIASDGLLTASARSGRFALATGKPQAYIFPETVRGKTCIPLPHVTIRAGEPIILHGVAHDYEDGDMEETALSWNLTGRETRSYTGAHFTLELLGPGEYVAFLNAADSDKQTGGAQIAITVDPHFVENATPGIVVDGLPNEPAYLADSQPLAIRYSNAVPAQIRMVHRLGKLYVGASGLRLGTDANSSLNVSIDTSNSGNATPHAGDFRFDVYADGRVRSLTGVNGIGFIFDTIPNGVVANVSSSSGFWSAELCVDLARFGGWSGQTVGLAIGHQHIDLTGEANAFWPARALENNPSTWGKAVFAPDPNDPTDTDHDGLPDRWEMTHFGDLKQDGLDDPDKDQANNASEFAAGTNPRDGKQSFRVMIERSAAGVRLSWLRAEGRLYNVLRSDTLDAWEPVALGVVGSEWADNSPPRAFYRVEVCQDR